jgi:hypothetical protein
MVKTFILRKKLWHHVAASCDTYYELVFFYLAKNRQIYIIHFNFLIV